MSPVNPQREPYDAVILGAGLAGLSLARQLLLSSRKRILVLDKRSEIPAPDQKVGEATVQVSGYYFSKVLDLEEHLFLEHLMKYNLRFHWKTGTGDSGAYEGYGQAYIRNLSNIASYQLDRNKLEAELLRLNLADPCFTLAAPVRDLDVELAAPGPHRVSYTTAEGTRTVTAEWVVDGSGRARILARQLGLTGPGPIRHGSAFLWVDGLVDIERLTARGPRERRLKRERASLGHLPFWLATNHFVGEGFWVWVIPLQGKTSIGLVFDREVIDHREVSSAEKLIAWIVREFPLFGRDLPGREVVHFAAMPDYGYDCAQTISAEKWAMTGMAGRFSDPLYSPGGDLIAIHNTAITDAILTGDSPELPAKIRAYEQLLRAVYEAYVPGYAESYNVLGDQEAFILKYTWELAIYFAFYVFPFINDLFTDRRFLLAFFNRFGRLGPANRNLVRFLSAYARWAKAELAVPPEPILHDFPALMPLAKAEKTFYKVGLTVDEAKEVLAEQLSNLEELARFTLAYLTSVVVGDPAALFHREFVAAIDLATHPFDPEELRRRWRNAGAPSAAFPWTFDATVMEPFRAARGAAVPLEVV